MSQGLQIAIVEDESLFRSLLARALEQCGEICVKYAYSGPEQALAECGMDGTDVALIDIDLGSAEMDGIQLGLQLRERYPTLGVVLLSNHPHLAFARALIASNAVGWAYLLKKSVQELDTVRRAVQGVHRGEIVLDPWLVDLSRATADGQYAHLTPRQRQLWELITQGYSNAAIAQRLNLSTKWIDNAVGTLYAALDINTTDSRINARVAAAQAFARATQTAHLYTPPPFPGRPP